MTTKYRIQVPACKTQKSGRKLDIKKAVWRTSTVYSLSLKSVGISKDDSAYFIKESCDYNEEQEDILEAYERAVIK